ncbi:MAG: hypothetical protein LBJ91_00525 [Clostridiales Family XIII bacterium]|jgi:hypothetical protein|nr:hypothetical protein [Clostridiales Family XIII bacterium]
MAAKKIVRKTTGLNCLTSPAWWNAAGTRALKSFAQGAIVGFGGLTGLTMLSELSWGYIDNVVGAVIAGAAMAIISLLTSIGGIPEVDGAAK